LFEVAELSIEVAELSKLRSSNLQIGVVEIGVVEPSN
jgi:hypothetical protein